MSNIKAQVKLISFLILTISYKYLYDFIIKTIIKACITFIINTGCFSKQLFEKLKPKLAIFLIYYQ